MRVDLFICIDFEAYGYCSSKGNKTLFEKIFTKLKPSFSIVFCKKWRNMMQIGPI